MCAPASWTAAALCRFAVKVIGAIARIGTTPLGQYAREEAHFTEQESVCRRCGHRELTSISRPVGSSRLWFAYCPACQQVQDHAAIPEWFLEGLPPPARRGDLH